MPTVWVNVETAGGRRVSINFEEVELNAGGKGRTSVAFDEVSTLNWEVVGTPGTSYKITLKPVGGKLKINGKHPVDLRIANGFTRAGGHRYFKVERPAEG